MSAMIATRSSDALHSHCSGTSWATVELPVETHHLNSAEVPACLPMPIIYLGPDPLLTEAEQHKALFGM